MKSNSNIICFFLSVLLRRIIMHQILVVCNSVLIIVSFQALTPLKGFLHLESLLLLHRNLFGMKLLSLEKLLKDYFEIWPKIEISLLAVKKLFLRD